jgi:hypothetical protein
VIGVWCARHLGWEREPPWNKSLLLLFFRKEQDRKILLFLKKKKQKDFYSVEALDWGLVRAAPRLGARATME